MEPTYFGNNGDSHGDGYISGPHSSSPLLGLYHPPDSFQGAERAVLLCYPMFQEHIRSYRAYYNLANKLAAAGCHVLRFDYFGTGDSMGWIEEATLERWIADTEMAIDELKSLSGLKSVTVIGLRFGATIAALQDKHMLEHLILWDPVIDGSNYLSDLRKIQTNLTIGVERYSRPRTPIQRDGIEEITGFSLSTPLIDTINKTKLLSIEQWSSKRVSLVASEMPSQYDALQQKFSDKLIFSHVNEPSEWSSLSKIEDMLMPFQVIAHLLQKIGNNA